MYCLNFKVIVPLGSINLAVELTQSIHAPSSELVLKANPPTQAIKKEKKTNLGAMKV